MTDTNFSVKNGLNVNGAISVNSTLIIVNSAAISANGGLGIAGQVLASNGSATYWTTPAPSSLPGGSNTNVQINDSGTLNGTSGFTFNKTTNNVAIANTLNVAALNNSGNVAWQTLTCSGTVLWNLSIGKIASLTLNTSCTFSTSNLCIDTCLLHIYQDSIGGRNITWPGNFKWPSGIAPTLSTSGNAHDIITFACDGTNMYGTYVNNLI